jgi:hypothetical protein
MQNKLITISFILIFMFTFNLKGQKLVNSPYSRFNIGSLDPPGTFRSLAMGGTGVAIRDNSAIYYVNPASYSSLDTTSFLFDFGVDFSFNSLSNGVNKYHSKDMNFNHLIIGFPLAKGWGLAAGLVPVSNGYYNVTMTTNVTDPGYDPNIGQVTGVHKGEGDLTNFFVGSGLNVTKNFSIGANFNVLFGHLERTNQYDFADYANTFGQFYSEKLKLNGVNFDYGFHYKAALKNNYFLNLGFSMTAAKKYKSEFETLSVRSAAYTASLYSPDTLSYANITSKDSMKLPLTIRMGVSFGKKDKFVAAIDYVTSNWANAKIEGSNDYLANSKSWLFGVEFIPDKFSNYSFLSRVEYRLGGHIADNYLIINGVQIKEFGASCGVGLRMRNSFSKTNIYFDFTRKTGDLSKGLLNENYFTIGISLNLYDTWFYKQKYE